MRDTHLLTEREAASALGVSTRTMQGWRQRGDGPEFVKIGCRSVRYSETALQAYIQSGRRMSTSDRGATT